MGTDHDEIVSRLRSLGHKPVDTGTANRHMSFLGAAEPVPVKTRRRPMMVGALLAGALLGGTGLAAALPGSLPDQASSVAKGALSAVNLADDDHGNSAAAKAAAKAAKEARAAENENSSENNLKVGRFLQGCTAGTPPVPFEGTHGQYVKAHPDDPATTDVNERQVAAESDCGKPLSALEGANEAADEKEAKEENEGSGKPEDAGRPESPGKSEEDHPPAVAENEQGSENRSTDTGKAGDAGEADEHRPEGVGQPGS